MKRILTILVLLAGLSGPMVSIAVNTIPVKTIAADVIAATSRRSAHISADSHGEAMAKAQRRYPKGNVIGVRKIGIAKTYRVTLEFRR